MTNRPPKTHLTSTFPKMPEAPPEPPHPNGTTWGERSEATPGASEAKPDRVGDAQRAHRGVQGGGARPARGSGARAPVRSEKSPLAEWQAGISQICSGDRI